MKKLLWLDDVRNPFIGDWLMQYAPEFAYGDGEVIWVKNYNQFVDWITKNGLPTEIGFDHDLEPDTIVGDIMDIKNIGIGSDLCLNQPDSIVEWMRNGTWSKSKNYGEGSKNKPGFPNQPEWFQDARGFENIKNGLKKIGFSDIETHGILGNNWYNFYKSI